MSVDNGGSSYQQDLETALQRVEADRDKLAMALEQIARGAESNSPYEIAALAWKALRA